MSVTGPSPYATVQTPPDKYWASEEDPDTLVGYLIQRKRAYFNYINTSNFFSRIARNWRYYNNLYHTWMDTNGMEIRRGGDEGELALISVNHFRSLLHLIITFTTQSPPAWDTRAINSDYKSMQQAKLGNDILDFYMEDKKVEERLVRAVEDSLIFSVGYVLCTWDYDLGNPIAGDPATGQMVNEGDVCLKNPTIFDVFYDFTITNWDQCQWVCVRTPVNKWDLVAKYPDKKDEILACYESQLREIDYNRFDRVGIYSESTDLIDLWTFYHDKTAAMPEGRQAIYVGDELLEEGPLQYDSKPIYRIVPADFSLTSFGYTPAFELQGVQEAINSEFSTIVTNHKNLGPTKIWFQTGETINLAQLEPGVDVIQSGVEPKPINLCQTPREFFEFVNTLRTEAEYLSGVNSVARGQPEASLKSGAALALIDQKAMQYNSRLQHNYYQLLCDVGTAILLLLKSRPGNKRTIYIAGVQNRSELKEFETADLVNVNRVSVQTGNPLQRTIAGKTEIAQQLLQSGLIKTPEDYLTVLTTGQIKPLIDTVESQNAVIYDENDKLKNGEQVFALITDNQVLHILKHTAVLDSTEMRQNPIVAQGVSAHVLQHMQLLVDPMYAEYAAVFGYPAPIAPQMGPPPTGAPPGAGTNPEGLSSLPGPTNAPGMSPEPKMPKTSMPAQAQQPQPVGT